MGLMIIIVLIFLLILILPINNSTGGTRKCNVREVPSARFENDFGKPVNQNPRPKSKSPGLPGSNNRKGGNMLDKEDIEEVKGNTVIEGKTIFVGLKHRPTGCIVMELGNDYDEVYNNALNKLENIVKEKEGI